jgi:1,4-dihydroxy-2-naphthoate polyprenyltransferase
MARLRAWIQASRPLAQINVAVPLIYGQALAYAASGVFRWKIAGLVALFGVFDQLFIVYANDVADFASDAHNATFNRYSGGSRVVPEGKLTPLDLARAATLAFLGMAAVSAYTVFHEQRPFMVVLAAIAAHLLWVYSFSPFRLSYRGQGEILQGIGLGIVLPIVGYYAQMGNLDGLRPVTLLPGFLLGYAGNVTTALPDAPSDAATGKRSYPVRRGEHAARRASLVVIAAAALATPLAAPQGGVLAWLAAAGLAGAVLSRNLPLLADADAKDGSRCERFVTNNGMAITGVLAVWIVGLIVGR